MKKKISLFAFTAIMFLGYSQETETKTKMEFESEVPTVDRGAYTRSGQNINKGLQIELGTNYEWTDSHNDTYKTDIYSPIQGKLRIGLSNRVEIDLAISNRQMVVRAWDESSKDKYNYWSPLDAGIRAQIVDSKKKSATDVSLFVGLSVYTTQRSSIDENGKRRPWVIADRPTYVTPEFGLFVNHNLGKRFVLGYNAGLKWTGAVLDDANSAKNPDFYYTVRILAHAAKRFDIYAEHFNYIRKAYYPTIGFNGGIRYAVTKKFVLDANGGLGFNKYSPSAFAGVGLSYKIGK